MVAVSPRVGVGGGVGGGAGALALTPLCPPELLRKAVVARETASTELSDESVQCDFDFVVLSLLLIASTTSGHNYACGWSSGV